MSVAKDLENLDIELEEDVIFPPGDLLSDEPPLETELHLRQLILLIECLELWWKDRHDFYAFGNLTIYYSPRQLKSEKFRGPDFFVVLNTERKPRTSWVVWQEDGKYPHVIVEILSNTTAKTDRGLKKQIYQDTFRTPEYFWFEPNTFEFKGFQLVASQYQELQPNSQGWLWSQQLELYLGIHADKLRFFSPQGQLIPTPQEEAAAAQQQRELAQQQAQAAQQQRELVQQQAQVVQQQVTELESLLTRYREQFGELPN